MRPAILAIALLSVVALAACFPPRGNAPVPELTPAITASAAKRFPGTTEAQVAQGRALMVAHCGECHGMPAIDSEPAQEWADEILPEMAKKAKLNADETAALTRFVLGVRDLPAAP
jgi:hypothetical protein